MRRSIPATRERPTARRAPGAQAPAEAVLQLQRMAGNRATTRLLRKGRTTAEFDFTRQKTKGTKSGGWFRKRPRQAEEEKKQKPRDRPKFKTEWLIKEGGGYGGAEHQKEIDAVKEVWASNLFTELAGKQYAGKARLDHLADAYAAPGAMTASIGWYRAGSGGVASALAETEPDERIATPTTVLWQEHDPLFPRAWADRLDAFFSDFDLRDLDGVGHFTPLEAPEAFAAAIRERI